jgi:hypothetical protein
MKEIFRKLVASLTTEPGGFSARKLSALVIMSCAVAAQIVWLKHSYKHDDFMLLGEVLMIDFAFVGACLGMTTWEKLKLKSSKDEPTT